MWYQKKQEKLFFPYISNSMLFSVPHENNGPLSKCKLFTDPHGIYKKKYTGRKNNIETLVSGLKQEKKLTWGKQIEEVYDK